MSWTRAGSSLSLASAKKHLFPCIGLAGACRGKLIGTCATNKAVRVNSREDDAVKLADRLTWRLCHCLRARLFSCSFPARSAAAAAERFPPSRASPSPYPCADGSSFPLFTFNGNEIKPPTPLPAGGGGGASSIPRLRHIRWFSSRRPPRWGGGSMEKSYHVQEKCDLCFFVEKIRDSVYAW